MGGILAGNGVEWYGAAPSKSRGDSKADRRRKEKARRKRRRHQQRRARAWLEQGFVAFYTRHGKSQDPEVTRRAARDAARDAAHDQPAAYRRLLREYPHAPLADAEWLRHPPPTGSGRRSSGSDTIDSG